MTIDATHLIRELHGESFRQVGDAGWEGYFGGTVAVEHIEDRGDILTFDLRVATSEDDVSDYFWVSEQVQGTTDKVILTQDGYEVSGARITGLERTAISGAPDEYTLTFEVPKAAVEPSVPLEVRARWRKPGGEGWIDLAVATTP